MAGKSYSKHTTGHNYHIDIGHGSSARGREMVPGKHTVGANPAKSHVEIREHGLKEAPLSALSIESPNAKRMSQNHFEFEHSNNGLEVRINPENTNLSTLLRGRELRDLLPNESLKLEHGDVLYSIGRSQIERRHGQLEQHELVEILNKDAVRIAVRHLKEL